MLDGIISETAFRTHLGGLLATRRLIGPVARDGSYFYEELAAPELLDLSFNYCVQSPRRFLLPPTETLFTFEKTATGFSARPCFDARPTALVGVHPCDLHAIRLLDQVFQQDVADEHYLARRRNMLVVGVDCARPCTAGVFCADMNCNVAEEGFDAMLYPLDRAERDGTRFGVAYGSDAGRAWLAAAPGLARPGAADQRAFEEYQARKAATFPRALKTRGDALPDLLGRSYDSLLWEATARRCYSCGSCNLVCPTCYCFNIRDDVNLRGDRGQRLREWDGCQLREFALVAGGHNFRPKPAQRLRHRIFRKGKWIRERTGGMPGCVGCGRCDRACTAGIRCVDIYNQLAEEA